MRHSILGSITIIKYVSNSDPSEVFFLIENVIMKGKGCNHKYINKRTWIQKGVIGDDYRV